MSDEDRDTDVSELAGADTDRFSSDFDVRVSTPGEDAADGIRMPPLGTPLPSQALAPMYEALAIAKKTDAKVDKVLAQLGELLVSHTQLQDTVGKLSERQTDTASAVTASLIDGEGDPDMISSKCTILVVDDNELLRAAIVRKLERCGPVRILEAYSVNSALAFDEPIDSALIDVRLPEGGNGIALAKEIRRRNPHCKIVIITGGDISMLSYVVADFGGELFAKPFKLAAVRRALVPQQAAE